MSSDHLDKSADVLRQTSSQGFTTLRDVLWIICSRTRQKTTSQENPNSSADRRELQLWSDADKFCLSFRFEVWYYSGCCSRHPSCSRNTEGNTGKWWEFNGVRGQGEYERPDSFMSWRVKRRKCSWQRAQSLQVAAVEPNSLEKNPAGQVLCGIWDP